MVTFNQWLRSAVKLRVQRQSGHAIKLFQTPRKTEKLVLPSIFDTSFVIHHVKLAELSNNCFE